MSPTGADVRRTVSTTTTSAATTTTTTTSPSKASTSTPPNYDAAVTEPRRIAYQGEPGANSHQVCREHYPELEAVPCASFEDVFAAVEGGEADLAMIPIDNSIAGRVADIHHFLPDSGLHIVAEHFLRIRFHLLGIPGRGWRRSAPCTATCTPWASAARSSAPTT